MDPYNAIQLHKSKFVNSSIQEIHITRQSGIIIWDLFKKLKQGELDIQKVPDITFVGKKGNDAYGLMKEFFTLLMNALTGTGRYVMFEGADDHLLPVISEEFHQSGYFRYVGQLIAMSVLHGGLGMVGLSSGFTVFIVTDDA